MLLSHAHIDHSGLLPLLWKQGFRGRIYATHATYSLCALMLLDSAHIHEKDLRFVNRIRARKEQPAVEPLYDRSDALGVLDHFVGVSYRQSFSPLEGVSAEYRDAGHILGSASMVLSISDGSRTFKLGFTGDVGNPGRAILRDPQAMDDCDYLISESTYGGEVHEAPEKTRERLAEVIISTSSRGGRVIILPFAVGRTQEIVHALDQLWNEQRLPSIPVYVDSPLAVRATEVYLAHPECYDADLQAYLEHDLDPFGFDRLTYIRDVKQSKRLNTSRYPMVIIFGEEHHLRCRVEVMNSLSAHADEPGLLGFLAHLDRERLRRVFLVHGAPQRQDALKQALEKEGYSGVSAPSPGESFDLH